MLLSCLNFMLNQQLGGGIFVTSLYSDLGFVFLFVWVFFEGVDVL